MSSPVAKSNGAKDGKPLLIGELANLAGVSADSIRFYERRGLLAKPHRLASGYRAYEAVALKRVRFIKQAQALGFSLDDIQRILDLREHGETACGCVIGLAETTLQETQKKIAELNAFAETLETNLRRWRRLPRSSKTAAEFCRLIESAPVPSENDP